MDGVINFSKLVPSTAYAIPWTVVDSNQIATKI